MKDNLYTVIRNETIAPGTFLLTIAGDDSEITGPGQFINIKLDGMYLRRPMSICDYGNGQMTIVYKVVGQGTEALSNMKTGDTFYALSPLGNGFDVEAVPEGALLIGGGAGAMPIYKLAKLLRDAGKDPHVMIGFNRREEIFFKKEFASLDVRLTIATMDGSEGVKGTVVDAMGESAQYVCACGPEPMLETVAKHSQAGQFDLGARMACGFGACMGCTVITTNGPKRVCKEGPIFELEEIIW